MAGCGCNDTYNGNCNCSESVELLTAIAVGPTGATGATGANGVDGEAVWYNTMGVPKLNTVGTEEVLNTYTIDNTPTVALGNGDVLYLEGLFVIKGGAVADREVRIRLDGTTLASYIVLGGSTPVLFYSVELHVALFKISNTSQTAVVWVHLYGSPDTIIHTGVIALAKNFTVDLVTDTTSICSGAFAAGDISNVYFLIKRAKHV